MTTNNSTILSVRNLQTHFYGEGSVVKAVDGVSFELKKGETLGIVGESGSGKSVTNLSILRLIPYPPGKIIGGEVIFDNKNLMKISENEIRRIRGKRIAMIFQDPMTSLNPFMSVGAQLKEITELHEGLTASQARKKAIEMLEIVGIPDSSRRIDDYPHQFSGGMRQRVMIAMALSCKPELLIADEPTTALDVTIQAQILELIKDLKEKIGTSVILITHDLGIVAGMADHIAVMYAGKIVEYAPTEELFSKSHHPYTKGLLKSVPDPTLDQEKLFQIPGLPPDLSNLPKGCPFSLRCSNVKNECQEFPPIKQINDQHYSACWLEN